MVVAVLYQRHRRVPSAAIDRVTQFDIDRIEGGDWAVFLSLFGEAAFAREVVPDLLRLIIEGLPAGAAIRKRVPRRATEDDIAGVVAAVLELAPEIEDAGRRERHLMGRAMVKLRGAADGHAVLAAIREGAR